MSEETTQVQQQPAVPAEPGVAVNAAPEHLLDGAIHQSGDIQQQTSDEKPAVTTQSQHENNGVPEEVKAIFTDVADCKSVQQDYPTSTPLSNKAEGDAIGLSLPSLRTDDFKTYVDTLPNLEITETAEGAEWFMRVEGASIVRPSRNMFDRTVDRTEALFKQFVDSEKGKLAPGNIKLGDASNTKVSGEKAVLRMRAAMGLGSVISIPLWHSGFWITIKAPNEAAELELNRRIAEEKISLGRATYGLMFANTSVFFAGWLIDFALAHVYDTSLKVEGIDNIRKHISQLDIPILVWGLACATYPNGFPYARAVMDKDHSTSETVKEKINVGKLIWVDNNSFTPWQIAHMAQRGSNTMTLESIEKYKSEFTRGKGRTIEISDKISINLRVPTIDQYLTSGQRWVNGIVNMIDKAFGLGDNSSGNDAESERIRNNKRNSYIIEQGKATNMRQYGHYVESIEVMGALTDDEETLNEQLNALSADDNARKIFFDSVIQFIEDSTVAVIATPVVKEKENETYPRFPRLLVIDPMTVFFILLVQKVTQIQQRN